MNFNLSNLYLTMVSPFLFSQSNPKQSRSGRIVSSVDGQINSIHFSGFEQNHLKTNVYVHHVCTIYKKTLICCFCSYIHSPKNIAVAKPHTSTCSMASTQRKEHRHADALGSAAIINSFATFWSTNHKLHARGDQGHTIDV